MQLLSMQLVIKSYVKDQHPISYTLTNILTIEEAVVMAHFRVV